MRNYPKKIDQEMNPINKIKTPEQIFGQLYVDMHLSGIWEDGKFISDLIPKQSPDEILQAYEKQKTEEGFSLKDFVGQFFDSAIKKDDSVAKESIRTIDEHISSLWGVLAREADTAVPGSSLLPLMHRYIVPGGRFNEIYYWDSYFTMLGLIHSNRVDLVESMVNNFTEMIYEFGHIPNGNRSYFLSRSQPPFYSMMIDLLAKEKGRSIYVKYLKAMLLEYEFWMSGDRRVEMADGVVMNRYSDNAETPRAEMYGDDYRLASESKRSSKEIFKNIRAACESGWDFSSRWLADNTDLGSIKTHHIIPVDLNCLIYNLENTIAKTHEYEGNYADGKRFKAKANARKAAILQMYDKKKGYFFDIDLKTGESSEAETLAGVFPMFFELLSQKQALKVKDYVTSHFLAAGGLTTSTVVSGQQWDAPNGWAPLQWIAIQGLHKYQFHEVANNVTERWCKLIEAVFQRTGKLMEKYNVVDLSLESGGGEYPVQDGFGWTNGVYLDLVN